MQPGTTLRNRYRILQKLGSGGFGDTYLAEDGDLPGKPRCVVKHLKPQQSNAIVKAKELFEREAETLYKLGKKNEGIPELFAYFEEGGEFYLVQEYIEGRDFSRESLRAVTSQHPRRRQFLSWLVFGGMGFGVAALSGSCSSNKTIETFTTVKVNSQGQIIERLSGKAEAWRENLGNGVTLEMVSIPGGTFLMGSPENEERLNAYDGREEPQHYVNVPAFFLGKYPVTQAQYQAVTGNNPSNFKGANRPVERVSWNDATEFCQRLSRLTGKIYRLPSEAEWEYACRAGTTTPFYFGPTITTELANYDGYSTYGSAPKGVYRRETTDVGSFPPNAFGLYDMHGNVWESCQDVWHDNYNGAPTDGSAWVSGGDSSRRMLRGGSWWSSARDCRCAFRFRDLADLGGNDGGFRVVLLAGL